MMVDTSFAEKNETKFIKKILAQVPDLFFQFTVADDFSIVFDYLGSTFKNFYELTDEEVEDDAVKIMEGRIHPDDLLLFKASIFQACTSLSRWELEYRLVLPSKGIKWIKVSAQTEQVGYGKISFYGIKSDITLQKSQEELHRLNDERNKFATMASNVGVWDWNLITNEVWYSPESLKILEIDDHNKSLTSNPEEWDERVHPDDRALYFDNMKRHFEGENPYYETYHRVLCSGTYKWILDRGKVILRDANNKPLRIIGTHTDISSQKEREQNLLVTLDLVNNQKNKLLNFAYIVSHNLKNHTGNLSSLLKLNQEGMFDREEFLSYLKIVSDELTSSIDNLIGLVRIQNTHEVEKDDLNLNLFLNRVLNILVEEIHNKKTEVVNHIPEDFSVSFNPAYLESVLLNLTTNAIKYSSDDRALKITYSVETTKDYKIVNVSDNGLGMDLEKYGERLFGLYNTFHSHQDSKGIGLYITKNQIEIMGGKIEVKSGINQGSTFKIYFKN